MQNKAGLFGAYASGFLNDLFGVASLLWPLVFAAIGIAYISLSFTMRWWRWGGFFLLTLCLLVFGAAWDISIGDLSGGGMIGKTLNDNAGHYLSPAGSLLLWFFIFLVGLQLAGNFSWFALFQKGLSKVKTWLQEKFILRQKSSSKKTTGRLDGFFHALAMHFPKLNPFNLIREHISRFAQKNAGEQTENILHASPENNIKTADEPRLPSVLPQIAEPEDEQADEKFNIATDILLNAEPAIAPTKKLETEKSSQLNPDSQGIKAQHIEIEHEASSPAVAVAVAGNKKTVAATLPPLDLLKNAPPSKGHDKEDLNAKGEKLMGCLGDFDIQGTLVRITPGPVVTIFEVRPAKGIRVSKIANLSDDLSLALKAIAVRIQAPIPGSDTVGIEIPNDNREMVNFRELAESRDFVAAKGTLTMALGKDIAGQPYYADLAKMPHLLVAGATGTGKSVCLNSILISLLIHVMPAEMRFLLIDPKRIEMAMYADLPHLIHPVVTDMSDAKNALEWAVNEMEKRYKSMAELGVRNVASYNQKLESFQGDRPSAFQNFEPMPYLVIVIDELADLMMTSSREVETSIVRLAQMARAAGIHMILATQRPSVDVVTGLIKTNFPCRISFQVTSKHDSRTILDQNGAEHLLGRGDMLFKPSAGPMLRLHGPFLSNEEVQSVVDYWKNQLPTDYAVDFNKWNNESAQSNGASDATSDELYEPARDFVLEQGRASISLLQRHLKIGFNRAARLMEQFEREGIIGPADGSKPRQVIR